jgi:aryl-phospho-beta-D-glucosidase BglC (GH1 family)
MRVFAVLFLCLFLISITGLFPVKQSEAYGSKCDTAVFKFSNLRGINLSLHTNPSSTDFKKLSSWGVNLLRIVVHADPDMPQYRDFFQNDLTQFNEDSFQSIDNVIKLAGQNDIKVIIDMHTVPGVKTGKLWQDYKYWDSFELLWVHLAVRYKNNPSVIGYDLLNEPNLVILNIPITGRLLLRSGRWSFPEEWRGTPRDYFALMTRISKAINRIDPKAIIVEGVGLWGHPVNFNWMEPIDACNVVYSFHMYVPHNFTHAGKNNKSQNVQYVSGKQRQRIISAMEPVVQFAEKHSVPIFIGELGLTYHNEGRGASEWLHDVLGFFEQKGWPWTYWTYSIDFRSPEVLFVGEKTKLSQDTERLTTLKTYWDRNKRAEPAAK